MKELNCLIIVGEPSGEDHCMDFIDDLLKILPEMKLWGVGGTRMANKGVELLYPLKDFSSWGISEVISRIFFYKRAENHLIREVKKRGTKAAILIDFQTFNMRMAKRLKGLGVQVFYYVAPQAWVWKEYRVKILKETVDVLFTLLPFEKKWFLDRGVNKVCGVKHPLLRHCKIVKEEPSLKKTKILLLPGSRNFEVRELLPLFIQSVKCLDSDLYEIGIVFSSNVNIQLYRPYRNIFKREYSSEDIQKSLGWADIAIAASGTVTLHCALFEVPTIVSYKTSYLNYFFFDTFIRYNGLVSLANIVHNEEVYPELIQESCSSYNISKILKSWIPINNEYYKIKDKLKKTKKLWDGDDPLAGVYIAKSIGHQNLD